MYLNFFVTFSKNNFDKEKGIRKYKNIRRAHIIQVLSQFGALDANRIYELFRNAEPHEMNMKMETNNKKSKYEKNEKKKKGREHREEAQEE